MLEVQTLASLRSCGDHRRAHKLDNSVKGKHRECNVHLKVRSTSNQGLRGRTGLRYVLAGRA